MSQFLNILLSPVLFFFGENGIFSSLMVRRSDDSGQALYFGIPALVFAMFGLLFLIVGELNAGKTLIQKYEDRVEEISKKESALKGELSQEFQMARANNKKLDFDTEEFANLRSQLAELLKSKQILLSKLHSLAPDQAKHQFQLAGTFFTKSELMSISPATSKQEIQIRGERAKSLKEQGVAIMKQIAPEDNPGHLEAHLYLAKASMPKTAKSARERFAGLRLADLHLNHALVRDEGNTSALSMKVLIAQKFGKYDDAKEHLQKLFDTDPFVYPQLCQLNIQLGEIGQNLTVLHSARERLSNQLSETTGSSDRRTKCATYLVDCMHRLDNVDAADKIINEETARFPEESNVQLWATRLLAIGQELRFRAIGTVTAENASEMMGFLRAGYRFDPANQKILEHIVRIRSSDVPGIAEQSEEIYQPGEKAPASVENILGTQALANKDYLEATKRIARASQKNPLNGEYLNNLAYVYLIRSDPDPREALKLIDRAILNAQGANLRPEFLTHFYDTKGRALLELGKISEENGDLAVASGQYAAATAQLLKALIERPRDLGISKILVECYKANGQNELAEVWAQRVKQIESGQN